MYFELTAPSQVAYNRAIWEAETMGLDPEAMSSLTFNVGTGSIEKVSNLRDKFNLTETYTSEFEPTGY
jgi:GH24 family phage-related lysozyme (muramidase)